MFIRLGITGIGSVLNVAKVEPEANIAVFGLGGVGLSALIGAKMAKAKQILAIDKRIQI